jgi:hypothetical protein
MNDNPILFVKPGGNNALYGPPGAYLVRHLAKWCLLVTLFFFAAACRPTGIAPPVPGTEISQQQPQEPDALTRGNMTIPPHTEIDYGPHETPSRIKGEDLALNLRSLAEFKAALNSSDYREMAYIFLEHYKSFLQLPNPRNDLRIESIRSDALGTTHTRFRQQLNNIPVEGASVLIHFSKQNTLYLFQGAYLPPSALQPVNTTAALTASEAAAIALHAAPQTDAPWKVQDNSLIVYIRASREPRLAYGITLARGLVDRDHYIIDAADGRILEKTSLIRH